MPHIAPISHHYHHHLFWPLQNPNISDIIYLIFSEKMEKSLAAVFHTEIKDTLQ